MKQYFLNTNNIRRILIIGLKYGLAVGVLTIALRYLLLSNVDRVQGNVLGTLVAVLVLIVGQYLAFKVFNQKHPQSKLMFLPTLTVGLIFSICLGTIAGLTHYIEATYIDPEWSMKALEYARETWAQNGYNQEAISGQVELTSTFQTPILWAVQIMKFLIIVNLGIALMVTTFMKVLEDTSLTPVRVSGRTS